MFEQAPKLRKRGAEDVEEGGKCLPQLLWQLDSRLRTQEGFAPAYSMGEDETMLVPALEAANGRYDAKFEKGKAHPDGPRRTTLAAATLNTLAAAKLQAADPKIAAEITKYNLLAAMTKRADIQSELLCTRLPYTKCSWPASSMEPLWRRGPFMVSSFKSGSVVRSSNALTDEL